MSPSTQSYIVNDAHSRSADEVLQLVDATTVGLSRTEAERRLHIVGPNTLPSKALPGLWLILLRQFLNPMIYVLLVAAVISIVVVKYSDAAFIILVLVVNAIIGAVQERSAQKSASALQQLVTRIAHVERDGEVYEISAESLVPGDIVLLEAGDKVPAGLRLLSCNNLQVDESLLTGESVAVQKQVDTVIELNAATGERSNMAFAGTLVTRGRGRGVVVGTGIHTMVGRIAESLLGEQTVKPPLIVRMERFTYRITIALGIAILLMGAVTLARGMPLIEVLLFSAALAVAAIPEGLPVALTVALSLSMRRMAKRHVIARRLVTVEALGSCTYIATDKTGTLTVNEMTVRQLVLAGADDIQVSGEGIQPEGEITATDTVIDIKLNQQLVRMATCAALTNEAFLGKRDGAWVAHGDAVDIALLVFAHKLSLTRPALLQQYQELGNLPFDSSAQYSASLNDSDGQVTVHVKGAVERLLPMCTQMASATGDVPIDADYFLQQTERLASEGYRVLALAAGPVPKSDGAFTHEQLTGLCLLGLVGMIDPLRKEVKEAVHHCHEAGLGVALVTGDHPTTALAIARELKLAEHAEQVVAGPQLAAAIQQGPEEVQQLVAQTKVFARIEPQQKLAIVQALQRNGHFVAVTGDGVNDAPALRVAHVGVAMGERGTDVARETSDMIITNDNFASIVSGIEEGRIAYGNVRKVIFLLISTGAAEIVLFTLSLLTGLPLPLTAVQLLWLNLVSNGIQDVALAFEPGEGNELKHKPRAPGEAIFNRLMLERVIISALVMGSVAFLVFQYLIELGVAEEAARNQLLLLMVLFENVHVFNSRSETRSVFQHKLFSNPFLVLGTLGAQALHITAMYTPGLSSVLQIQPVTLQQWSYYLLLGMSALVVSEIYKLYRKYVPLPVAKDL